MPRAESDYQFDTTAQKVRGESLQIVERRNRVIRLRRAGATYEQISMALARDPDDPITITANGCARIVRNYLERCRTEDAESLEEIRQMENERLDEMLSGVWSKAKKGDTRAIKTVLGIMDRRAKLNGLDAAQRHEHVGVNLQLHQVADPDEVARLEEAFVSSFSQRGIPDVVINVEQEEVRDAEAEEAELLAG